LSLSVSTITSDDGGGILTRLDHRSKGSKLLGPLQRVAAAAMSFKEQ